MSFRSAATLTSSGSGSSASIERAATNWLSWPDWVAFGLGVGQGERRALDWLATPSAASSPVVAVSDWLQSACRLHGMQEVVGSNPIGSILVHFQ
jgi:hypothetical protein